MLYREGGAGGIALGALNGHQLGLGGDGLADAFVIEAPVRQQVHLPVGHAVLLQGAGALPDADDLLQGVVGSTCRGQKLISRQEIGGEGHGEGMGAAGDLRPHQGRLGVEYIGIHPLQVVPPHVVIPVAGGGGKAGGGHPVALHGVQDLPLVVFRYLIDDLKPLPKPCQNLLPAMIDSRGDPQFLVHFQQFVHGYFLFVMN